MDSWLVFVQVHRSHDVASRYIYKLFMFVRYASRRNAALDMCLLSVCRFFQGGERGIYDDVRLSVVC